MSRSNFYPQEHCVKSPNNLELCELQQELLRTGISEVHGGLGILTRTLNLRHRSHTKALVLYRAALMQIAGVRI